MTRLSHLSENFMPLFATRSPKVLLTSILSLLAFLTISFCLAIYCFPIAYNDANDIFFEPDSQDFFRVFLLGFISPCIYHLISIFSFNYMDINIKERLNSFVWLNLFWDYPMNDIFQFIILLLLAYPQLRERKEINNPGINLENWDLTPLISVIFALSWTSIETIISIFVYLPFFKEIDDEPNEYLNFTQGNDPDEYSPLLSSEISESSKMNNSFYSSTKNKNSDDYYNQRLINYRNNVTLAKCVKLRLSNSDISKNIYSTNEKSLIPTDPNIPENSAGGSTTRMKNIAIVSPLDNSINLQTVPNEGPASNYYFYHNILPNLKAKSGLNKNNSDGNYDSYNIDENDPMNNSLTFTKFSKKFGEIYPIIKFDRISNNKMHLKLILNFLISLLSIFFLQIGQTLIFSTYFIFTPSTFLKFSNFTVYFGSRTFLFFILLVIIPFIFFNFITTILLFYFKDFQLWDINYNGNNQNLRRQPNGANYAGDQSGLSSSYFHSSSINILNVPNILDGMYNNRASDADDYLNNEPFILRTIKKTLRFWKRVSTQKNFTLWGAMLWGLFVFSFGCWVAWISD